jgi:O-methyltransferase / aklanonic acid methyltransferase
MLKGSMANPALVSKLELIDFYDRIAPRYGRVGPAVFAHLGRRLAELTGVADGSRVLDIAIGHGASLLPASELVGAGGLVIGVDLAAEMVKETHSELSRMGLQNVTVLRMDAEQLAFSEVTFDHLLCGFAIFFFPQPDRTLLEWSRVLRPGGKVGISVSGGGDERWQWYEELLLTYHHTHHFPLSPAGCGLRKPAEVEAALSEAGFVNIQVMTEEHEFVYADEQEWWEAKWTHGARYPLERMRPEVLSQFQTEVFSRLASMGWVGGLREKWRVVCIIGSKPHDD